MLQTYKVIHLNTVASEKPYQEKLKSHSIILQNTFSTKRGSSKVPVTLWYLTSKTANRVQSTEGYYATKVTNYLTIKTFQRFSTVRTNKPLESFDFILNGVNLSSRHEVHRHPALLDAGRAAAGTGALCTAAGSAEAARRPRGEQARAAAPARRRKGRPRPHCRYHGGISPATTRAHNPAAGGRSSCAAPAPLPPLPPAGNSSAVTPGTGPPGPPPYGTRRGAARFPPPGDRGEQLRALSGAEGGRSSSPVPPPDPAGRYLARLSSTRLSSLAAAGGGRGAAAAGRGGSGGACAAATQRRSPAARGSAAREEAPRRPRPSPARPGPRWYRPGRLRAEGRSAPQAGWETCVGGTAELRGESRAAGYGATGLSSATAGDRRQLAP
ncbi:uncharacterized protein LOC141729060 [Zonotrichia albicollis]|uniref:uncharacterized protein LOC141729060 n=1 Tax=Zonotrichia albicollis TaxID=44394 RepID=UPI003D80D5E4